ncbi:uncharacterized protein LOC110437539 [Sorghum bicolor]|uniref:uncharacterized protein LOC110437539 n=1 Tax=Sorghum bicolor TaxID=4558 RepID=UPI000B4263B3|nr:uncharacterized protein LOC110437539 [Sorghum bicolor]|eukprot:XP_021321685.1 uncharacterized protein LOC110437539 [Sorghum bicolor]
MAEPTTADLLKELKTMSHELTSLKADMAATKDKASTADSSDTWHREGFRDLNLPPWPKKWDFPRYDGTPDPLLFLNKFEAYFRHHCTMAEERMGMASYHLDDAVQTWYTQLLEDEGAPTWGRFKELLNLRFGPPLRSAPLFELAECRRTGTVEEYSNCFQALLPRAGRLDESQRVQLFTGGLLPPLSHAVRIHHPETLSAAMGLAGQVELMERDRLPPPTARAPPRGLLPAPAPRAALPAPAPQLALLAPPAAAPPGRDAANPRCLTPEEMAERRHLGLCFNCNEKYTRGHNRFCRRLFFLDGVEIDDVAPTDDAAAAAEDVEAPVFSLDAVAGVPIADTIKLPVNVGDADLLALLDGGSTHSFIGEEAARRAGLPIQSSPRISAVVANGERVACPGVIRNAAFTIHGATFHTDLFVMPLAGFDVVLGTRWLGTMGPIVWDFASRLMAFQRDGHHFAWTGVASPSTAHLRTLAAASGALQDELLVAYEDVFGEPTGLPPPRGRDHAIILKSGSAPVAVRPYRYPAAHKDELERQCATMIVQGVVRRSDSPFSSPVLLVKKADGSWRFCVDYHALNALSVKDAFPIPVVDELHGARFFTKLDLRSGYHQVRMRPEDVHKTAFRTHDGLYEFLVMPFRRCNAPATFQVLMNNVLRPLLRRFVLVFFDDILIYSESWTDHLRHMQTILSVLRQHQLFVKRSKCTFGAPSVSYLGHVISEAGVAMDPAKVQAIHEWPVPRSARAVRSFLVLAGYYRKFVHNYGALAAPLTALTKKDGLSWTADAAAAFDALKAAVTAAPVLAMPDFTKPFTVQCDASTSGFGAVLVLEGHPLAFFSRPVAPRHRALAAYERELIGLVHAVRHWRPYLWSRRFVVKTDHYSLKYLLDQRLATIPQHHWVGKLLGFDFAVEYKSGAANVVADDLSWHDTEEGTVLALSAPPFDFIGKLHAAQRQDPAFTALHDEVSAGTRTGP